MLSVRCPYATAGPVIECTAAQAAYRPSTFELSEYCTTIRHRLCAFYCKRQAAEDAETPDPNGKGGAAETQEEERDRRDPGKGAA